MKRKILFFALCIVGIACAYGEEWNELYTTGIFGQTFQLLDTDEDETSLMISLCDNKSNRVQNYDPKLPTEYVIWSKNFENTKEYSKAIKACKEFFDKTLTYVYLSNMKDICDIAPCCFLVDYCIGKIGDTEVIRIMYDCDDLDLLFYIASIYTANGREYVLRLLEE